MYLIIFNNARFYVNFAAVPSDLPRLDPRLCLQLATFDVIRSEFELLERDMRTLRDAVVAREEAWDKAVERERNCQQQLARLTAEAITARHLCETRQDELRVVTDALTVILITESLMAYRKHVKLMCSMPLMMSEASY